jgi:acetyl esterase/lipase
VATLPLTSPAGSDDAVSLLNGTGFDSANGATWLWMGRHTSTSLATCAGYRFFVPWTVETITAASFSFMPNNTGTWYGSIVAERSPAAAWANTSTDRPHARYDAAVTAGATPVVWNQTTSVGTGTRRSTSVTAADLQAALDANPNHATDGTWVSVIFKGDIGAQAQIQAFTRESGTAGNRPELSLTYDQRVVNVTATPSKVTVNVNVGEPVALRRFDGVSYNVSGHGDSAWREANIIVPADPTVSGRTIIALAGGYFINGSRGRLPGALIEYFTKLGYTIIDPSYKPSVANLVINVEPSFPEPPQDIRVLRDWLDTNGASYGIDTSQMVLAGHSAGGHVALWAALTDGDTTVYTGYQNVGNNRRSAVGHTRPSFDLDAGFTTQTPLKGVFVWAAPISMWLTSQIGGAQGTANTATRRTYMGEVLGQTIAQSNDELDLDRYIAGTSTVYGATTHEPTIPIGFATGLSDTTVPKVGAIDALVSALSTSGFTYDMPAVGTVTATGLTQFEYVADHETVITVPESLYVLEAWLEGVMAEEVIDVTVEPPTVDVTAAVQPVSVAIGAVAEPATVSVDAAAQAATAIEGSGAVATVATVSVAAAAQAVTVDAVRNETATVATVSVTAAAQAVVVESSATATVATVSVDAAAQTVTVSTGVAVTAEPATVTSGVAVHSPSVTGDAVATVATVVIDVAEQAADADVGTSVVAQAFTVHASVAVQPVVGIEVGTSVTAQVSTVAVGATAVGVLESMPSYYAERIRSRTARRRLTTRKRWMR